MTKKSNQSTFKIICRFAKQKINPVMRENDYEFEKRLASVKKTVTTKFAPEMDETTLSKMLKDFEFQIRIARSNLELNKKVSQVENYDLDDKYIKIAYDWISSRAYQESKEIEDYPVSPPDLAELLKQVAEEAKEEAKGKLTPDQISNGWALTNALQELRDNQRFDGY